MTPKKPLAPHLGLARKWRPKTFAEVVGQEAVVTTIQNSISGGKPAHAYLFFGPKGVGKTTTARLLAKALNCQKGPTAEPCGACSPCAEIAGGSAIDVLELDAATHTQVDKVREMIIETVALAPSRDRFKVFIIDEVHMLSAASFNALLKTLEEPPGHVVFILATTDSGKLPATIVSRCQRFRFRPLPVEELAAHLAKVAKAEGIKAHGDAFTALSRAAGGSLRDAVSLLEQAAAFGEDEIDAKGVRELLGELPRELVLGLAKAVLAKDAAALAQSLARAYEEGYDPAQLLRDLREGLHESYLFRLGVAEAPEGGWAQLAQDHAPEAFAFLVGRVNKTLESMRGSDSPRLALELGLYGALPAAYDLKEWVSRLEALERRVAVGGEEPAPGAGSAPGTTGSEDVSPVDSAPRAPQAPAGPAPKPWQRVLDQLREEKPGLAQELETCRLVTSLQGEWRLLFEKSFDMERAQINRDLLESMLSAAAGSAVRLGFEVAREAHDAARASPSGGRDLDEPPPEPKPHADDPGVKKVLEFFPGKVRQVKKK